MTLFRVNRSVLSPLLVFPAAWILAALLAQYHLLNTQGPWSTLMIEVVAVVPLAFVSGGLVGEGLAMATTAYSKSRAAISMSDRTFRRTLIVLLAIGLLELLHQFAKARAIPLLSGNIDAARFGQGGPTIVLTDLLTVAAIAALTKPRELLARESRFELGVAAIAIGSFGLQAGRGSVVLPIIVAILARWLLWGRPSLYLLAAGALVAFLAICFGFYFRVSQHPTTPFEAELFGEVLPSMPFFLKPLVPVYIALTTNFLALQGIVGHFPTVAEFGDGVYSTVAFESFFSGSENIAAVSANLTPPWVTSTVAGSFWADGGFPLLVIGVAVTGALTAGAFAAFRRTFAYRWAMVTAYLLFIALFGLYTNQWTQHIDWLIVAPCLFVLGAFAENPQRPPGVVGAVWGKLRGMRSAAASADNDEQADEQGRGPRWKRMVAPAIVGAGGVLALLGAGVVVQSTLPEPYPRVSQHRLPDSVADATALMTEGDRLADNSPLWWLNVEGGEARLQIFTPAGPDEGVKSISRFPLRAARAARYDIGQWPPLRYGALFEFTPAPGEKLLTTVRAANSGDVFERMVSNVGPPAPGSTRDYSIATFSGRIPDLFVIDRGVKDTRVSVRILSGESNFKTQVFATKLPFQGASPPRWSIDVGALAMRPPGDLSLEAQKPAADIAFIERGRDREHAALRVALGEDGFQGFSFQRDLDTPGDTPGVNSFLIGSEDSATVIYEVWPDAPGGPLLEAFGIQPPAGLL